MASNTNLETIRERATNRDERTFERPTDGQGNFEKISEYYGLNTFDFRNAKGIPDKVKEELVSVSRSNTSLTKESANIVAEAALEWALSHGATHFCHWFQPLTGSTAEKHDSFLNIKNNEAIEELSASQLMQGEPDASSFPNGGSRSTFEARGYTTWDLTSPMFLVDGVNGKTLCIPTAFVSYNGQALDIKTPLLRSEASLSTAVSRFMKAIGQEVDYVQSTCGAEQEYFLIDKGFFYSRPDLVMTGRTLFGSLSVKNQQLDDHYFGAISERVTSFMQELDFELHKLGIPSKTRHNEVAPGQYELAPIFNNSNVSADHNQIIMATIEKVAYKHDFVSLVHEKPFAGVNGSGKHINWSMGTSRGENLLEPGKNPETNHRFLAVTASIIEAVFRHGSMLRMSIASAGNDHRLGANEAPPSILSVYMGDTLEKILMAVKDGKTYDPNTDTSMDMGAQQLADLNKDNTDRNRTSPFAFTGNKFEFRACGSEMSIGFPISVLNAAIADVFCESADFITEKTSEGMNAEEALTALTKKWMTNAEKVIFNGDGYSSNWLAEAESRGLPNLRTSPDAIPMIINEKENSFLLRQKVFTKGELNTRYNVLLERYHTVRLIEFNTLLEMVNQHVIPAVIDYKKVLSEVLSFQKDFNFSSNLEQNIYEELNNIAKDLSVKTTSLNGTINSLSEDVATSSLDIAYKLMPLSEEIAELCNKIEEIIPSKYWGLPKYYDMLFLR
jgi:glutamine synthetase